MVAYQKHFGSYKYQHLFQRHIYIINANNFDAVYLKNEHRSTYTASVRISMGFIHRIAIIIYVSVFIFAKLFYCVDVNESSVTMAPVSNESTSIDNNSTAETNNQTTKLDSSTVPPQLEHGEAMQICNETNQWMVPKGMVFYGFLAEGKKSAN